MWCIFLHFKICPVRPEALAQTLPFDDLLSSCINRRPSHLIAATLEPDHRIVDPRCEPRYLIKQITRPSSDSVLSHRRVKEILSIIPTTTTVILVGKQLLDLRATLDAQAS